jgi:competence ComEA-like helix-hairpin-helix protein
MLALAFMLGVFSQPTVAVAADKININTAPAEVLQGLDGVGPALAERIVDYRQEQPFQSPADITQVKGIGDKTYADIKDRIMVE